MDAFAEFCSQFTTEEIPHVRIGKRYFYDPRGMLEFARERGWDAFSAGIYLGEDRAKFFATSALMDLLAQRCEKRVVVDDKVAWLFLCGRDILTKGVLITDAFKQGEPAIVADQDGAILGFGEIRGAFDPHKKNRVYLKHKLDRGEYLRRER